MLSDKEGKRQISGGWLVLGRDVGLDWAELD